MVVERNMKDGKRKDDGHVQTGVIPGDDRRIPTYLFYFLSHTCFFNSQYVWQKDG